MVHSVRGHVPLKIVHFIMNMRTDCHPFYLSRHGQSEYNQIGRIGGDSGLTEHGLAYARKLADFVESHIVRGDACGGARSPGGVGSPGSGTAAVSGRGDEASSSASPEMPARLWTSTMRRTRETAQFIAQRTLFIRDKDDPSLEFEWVQMKPRAWHHLDELFAGACDGMTYEEIEDQFPEEFERREKDKLAYRYPRGESYLDVIARLEPIILEMERHREPLLIVAHQGILRIIYAFYMGLSRAQAPFVSVPLNCVVKLTPSAYLDAAQTACAAPSGGLGDSFPGVPAGADAQLFCLDVTYCHALLTSGFGLEEEQEVTLVKQVEYRGEGVEAAWPLGAAINSLGSD